MSGTPGTGAHFPGVLHVDHGLQISPVHNAILAEVEASERLVEDLIGGVDGVVGVEIVAAVARVHRDRHAGIHRVEHRPVACVHVAVLVDVA